MSTNFLHAAETEGSPLLHHKVSQLVVVDSERWERRRRYLNMELMFLGILMIVVFPFAFNLPWGEQIFGPTTDMEKDTSEGLTYQIQGIHVKDRPSFPSYLSYAPHGPINVTYDKRSIMLNGTRVLLLSGSMHPARSTPETWKEVLDEAVRHGLNMITIYVFWSAHQQFPDQPMNWSLPNGHENCKRSAVRRSCGWDLATAITEAANRGLFVHIRIGPFACAEYNYGGIPEWVPLLHPDMKMRRPDPTWMKLMQEYVRETVTYLENNKLWAHQGGPILLAQIENELHVDDDTNITAMQGHADWCGAMAARLAPDVVWTMCMGLSANNTISTCNGAGDCISWLTGHGDTGRIQVDQPAMWTENEEGFQTWGEGPDKTDTYFWGRTARDFALQVMKWFARGGSHMNYYMFWGSYNRGRTAGAGIANMYASDAAVCPSGERRQPKFDHLRALHEAISDVAPVLMYDRSALGRSENIARRDGKGGWTIGSKQRAFVYEQNSHQNQEVMFVENDSTEVANVRVRILGGKEWKMLTMKPWSSVMLVDGTNVFDSASVNSGALSYKRRVEETVQLLNSHSWPDRINTLSLHPRAVIRNSPVEQTELMIDSGTLSDYAWYETSFTAIQPLRDVFVSINSQKANALVIFIDDVYVGDVENHDTAEGSMVFSVGIGDVAQGPHKLTILSESLGYYNIIGAFHSSTSAQRKGITGDVNLTYVGSNCDISLVDGRPWVSLAGLRPPNDIREGGRKLKKRHKRANQSPASPQIPAAWWSKASFDTPIMNQGKLFLDISVGRGHAWLNGHDLGRFWNISRGKSNNPTQRYYMLPKELLFDNGRLNELVLFNSLSGDISSARLVLSWIEPSDAQTFEDKVGFKMACLE